MLSQGSEVKTSVSLIYLEYCLTLDLDNHVKLYLLTVLTEKIVLKLKNRGPGQLNSKCCKKLLLQIIFINVL